MNQIILLVLLSVILGITIVHAMTYSKWIEWRIKNGKLVEYKTDWLTALKRILKKRTKEEDARCQGIYF